jgi:hypothetical protein
MNGVDLSAAMIGGDCTSGSEYKLRTGFFVLSRYSLVRINSLYLPLNYCQVLQLPLSSSLSVP